MTDLDSELDLFSDEYFNGDLQEAYAVVVTAAKKHDQILGSSTLDDVNDWAKDRLGDASDYETLFSEGYDKHFARFEQTSAAEAGHLKWQLIGVLGAVERVATKDASSLSGIEELTVGWRSPAGVEFTAWYLQLGPALSNLQGVVSGLGHWLEMQAALVQSVRAEVLTICFRTAAALDGSAARKDAKNRNRLAILVEGLYEAAGGSIGGTAGGGAAGGLAAFAGGAMTTLGRLFGNEIRDIGGDDPADIYTSMLDALDELQDKIGRGRSALFDVIADVVPTDQASMAEVLPPTVDSSAIPRSEPPVDGPPSTDSGGGGGAPSSFAA